MMMIKYTVICIITAALHGGYQFNVVRENFWDGNPTGIDIIFYRPAMLAEQIGGDTLLCLFLFGPFSILLGMSAALAVFAFDQRAGFFSDDLEEVL